MNFQIRKAGTNELSIYYHSILALGLMVQNGLPHHTPYTRLEREVIYLFFLALTAYFFGWIGFLIVLGLFTLSLLD